MHYDRNLVLAAYRAAHPNALEPEESVLENYDRTLRELYDEEIATQATAAGIPQNDFNRSMLVFFASRSPAVGYQTRVRHAVKFYLKVRPTPSVVA